MDRIEIKEKMLSVWIKEEEILKEVRGVGKEMKGDLGGKNGVLVRVLKGWLMFSWEVMKGMRIGCEICLVKVGCYEGVCCRGVMKEVMGMKEEMWGGRIVIVEDMVDRGVRMEGVVERVGRGGGKEIEIGWLVVKGEKLKVELKME